MGALTILKDAWVNRDKLGDDNKSRELAAFLPPALEIQEAPPNPLASWVARSLILLLSIAIAWACIGEVDIVASAEGKIIPSSRVKQIQPLEKGIVKAIHVTEGQHVIKGQVLIELDGTLTQADKTRLTAELLNAKFQYAISRTLLRMLDDSSLSKATPDFSSLTLLEPPTVNELDLLLHKQLLWQQWQQYQAQLKNLQSAFKRSKAQQQAVNEVIRKLEQTLPIVTTRRNSIKNLQDKQFASQNTLLELEQELIQQTHDLAAEKQRYQQAVAAAEEAFQQIELLKAQSRREQLTATMEAQRQISGLQEELTKANNLNAQQILYAPVSGQVQELKVATLGGVVTEAQQLMLIVPKEERLDVEVFLENKDIGFVEEGMATEIKIHTFPFTKYGVIDGEVMTISDDAIVDEKRGLIYGMRIMMKRSTIEVNVKTVKLMPGMAVTTEFRTGKRRIIEFFLAPLLKGSAESIRER
ncbi:HlyD family type I secretion periplasmic adaptor subunit [Psychrobium sp. nBUS_13]|uniref:HlyD family type I secretion periplasmic adaptor subunit n=1 Tax=Psychrobium sp. nBUS_13 TaxID=3395319 RepID=UPI003EB994F2